VAAVPFLLVVKEKPPTPPSASASRKEEPLNFNRELKNLLKNKSYLLMCVSFTSLYGVYTSLGAVVAAVTSPYGYSGTANAIFGGTFIFFGVVGSFVLGVALDKTQKYKLMINATSLCAVFFIGVSFYTLPTGNVALFAANLAFIGFCVIPIIPISYGFAVELTFPIPEAMSNGMMILPSQIYGAALVSSLK
jgi:sugar phosphate permease